MNNQEDLKTEEAAAKFNIVNYFEENKKTVLLAVGAIIVVIGGYFAYKQFVHKPKAQEGIEMLKDVQNFYGLDSFSMVINGSPSFPSAIEIAEDYSGTKAGELAHFYAGTSYLQMGEFESAIEHLEKVDLDDKVVQYLSKGALGDAYVETNDLEKGLSNYKTAARGLAEDLAATYYLKAGVVMEELGKNQEALDWYQEGMSKLEESPVKTKFETHIAKVKTKLIQ